MRLAPKLGILLTIATLAGPGSALAQGNGGAGDNQYQDPFGGHGGGSSGSASTGSGSSGSRSSGSSSSGSGLSQSPNLGTSSSGTSSTPTSTPAPATTRTPATAGALPNTGTDPRLLILAGLALLLSGAGLRLRTADERF